MANENLIGQGVCPVCGSHKARLTVSKKQLACLTCNACNVQIFSRSDRSDEKLRSFIRAAPIAEPISQPKPEPIETTSHQPEPVPKKSGMAWGFLGASN